MKFIRPFRCMTAQKILRLSFIIIIPFALLSCGETDAAINQEPEKRIHYSVQFSGSCV
ncbi:MAG: hypothetical protein IPK11_15390 [Ignavibacteria bacterium]|nr:hypothetical protein [Ignavibacteria bacterium]